LDHPGRCRQCARRLAKKRKRKKEKGKEGESNEDHTKVHRVLYVKDPQNNDVRKYMKKKGQKGKTKEGGREKKKGEM